MSDQLTLRDCEVEQIVVMPGDLTLWYVDSHSDDDWTELLEVYGTNTMSPDTTQPCRLATQEELDQLAERIRRAND